MSYAEVSLYVSVVYMYPSVGWANDFFSESYWQTATVQTVKNTIAAGGDVNMGNEFRSTPLMWASRSTQHPAVITTLIEAGADVNARNQWGTTPLMEASRHSDNPDVIFALIEAGADVNAENRRSVKSSVVASIFASAVITQKSDFFAILWDAQAVDDATSKQGKTAYDYILQNDALKYSAARWRLNDLRFK